MHPRGWLMAQRARQIEQGVDYRELACHPQLLTNHVHDHLDGVVRALIDCIETLPASELPEEEKRTAWETGRADFVELLMDVVVGAGAALNAVGCTEAEFDALNKSHRKLSESVDSNPVCAECKADVDVLVTGLTVLQDGTLICGKKCEKTYNQKVVSRV